MRKADVFRALFSALYTAHDEIPEELRDPKLGDYIDQYMPNFGKNLPPKDNTVMLRFKKFIDKRCKENDVSEEDAYEIAKKFIHDTTDFSEIFNRIPKEDWMSLCELIDIANEVNAVNAMKEEGSYEQMVRSGQGDRVGDYINEHPDLMSKANPNVAMQAMSGMGGMPMGMAGMGTTAASTKKTVHPKKKKKQKKKKK